MAWIGKHLIFDGFFQSSLATLGTAAGGYQFLLDLVDAIGMTVMAPPHVVEFPCDSAMKERIIERLADDVLCRTGHLPHPGVVDRIRNSDLVGISGLVILLESHAAFHTFPEVALEGGDPFVSLDIYSCKDFDTDACIGWLLSHGVLRGYLTEITRHTDQMQTISQTVHIQRSALLPE